MNFSESQLIDVPQLTDGEIVLRQCRRDDLDDILYYRRNPESCRYIRPPDSVDSITDLVEQHCQPWKIQEGYWNGIVINMAGESKALGEMNFKITDMVNQRAELGYRLNPDYTGKGLATRAGRLMIEYLFRVIGCHKVIARCDPRNIASSRVMEKLGMQKEGYFYSHFLIGDEWTDQVDYGLLRTDWEKSNKIQ
ncbi:GNAT family N-acetyltransferase [Aliikangiella marina]|uniref:GNAT family N-acetyltransferase n=1 Tax=Aliikangiella marina TaxID=1712262 RepID=A0A545TCN5_9GAMM|nr:GNAT family protein [Aliikangiella marina]TQV74984.1 GNAT family N-acetyltransferase [Aliikangiella marina]